MGNGVSSDQGNLPSRGKRDVRQAVDRKQHDWSELARHPSINTQLRCLLATANSYNGASNAGPSSSKENRKSSVMKDDMQFDAQGNNQLQNRKLSTNSPWLVENSSSGEEERRQKSEDRRRGIMQVEPETGQTAYTPRWQKTGSAMQIESRDPRSHSIQTACIPTGSNVQVEPRDVPVHPGQTARLPTGSSMQIESLDPRSRPIQTACTPPSLATQRQDRLTALPSLQLKTTLSLIHI